MTGKYETTDHQKMYPEQYSHQLIGKIVQMNDRPDIQFTVKRVVNTRFGLMAIPEGRETEAYLIRCLSVTTKNEQSTNRQSCDRSKAHS